MIENLLVLDTSFEPIDSDECWIHQITLGGFHAGVRSETRGYAFDFYYTISFFVFKTDTGLKATSAMVHHMICEDVNSGHQIPIAGCTILDPEPIVYHYEIDFDRKIRDHERQETKAESDVATMERPSLAQELALDIAQGLYNVSWQHADLWILGINTLIGAIEHASAED